MCRPRDRFNGTDLWVTSDAVAVGAVVVDDCQHAEFQVPQGEQQALVQQLPPASACQLLAAALWLAGELSVTGAPSPRFTETTVVSVTVLGFVGTGVAC